MGVEEGGRVARGTFDGEGTILIDKLGDNGSRELGDPEDVAADEIDNVARDKVVGDDGEVDVAAMDVFTDGNEDGERVGDNDGYAAFRGGAAVTGDCRGLRHDAEVPL